MKLILYRDPFATTEIDFEPCPLRCKIEQQHLDFAVELEGETENMCVWTKKRGSMNAVVLMATPCPKSLYGKGEKWMGERWVLLKIPRCDIGGAGEWK